MILACSRFDGWYLPVHANQRVLSRADRRRMYRDMNVYSFISDLKMPLEVLRESFEGDQCRTVLHDTLYQAIRL